MLLELKGYAEAVMLFFFVNNGKRKNSNIYYDNSFLGNGIITVLAFVLVWAPYLTKQKLVHRNDEQVQCNP